MVTGSSATLIGRQRELARLTASLDAVADGNGQLFLLEGEPGIGKTHLARALGEEARRRGFAVVWGRCWEEGGAPAYWPWTQVLRSVLRRRDARTCSVATSPECAGSYRSCPRSAPRSPPTRPSADDAPPVSSPSSTP